LTIKALFIALLKRRGKGASWEKCEMGYINESTIALSEKSGKNDITDLLKNKDLKAVQISDYISDEILSLLNERLFLNRSDVEFRVYGFHKHSLCDLSFLRRLTNVEKLRIDYIANVSNIDALMDLVRLKSLFLMIFDLTDYSILKHIDESITDLSLCVGERTSKYNCDCEWLSKFNCLETLYIGKPKRNINSLSKIRSLRQLTLRGITIDDLSFINELQLEFLAIHWGAIKNFKMLCGNTSIKSIELWRVSKLSDISFLNDLPKLEQIKLEQLANVHELPLFSKLDKLKRVIVDDLKNLSNVSSLEYVKNLEKVEIYSGFSITPNAILPVLNNCNIKEIICYTGSNKKNREISELCLNAGKKIETYYTE
jgi:hypothetical protein